MRPSILYPLFAPIEVLKGIGNKYAKLVKNLCGEKVCLLYTSPSPRDCS